MPVSLSLATLQSRHTTPTALPLELYCIMMLLRAVYGTGVKSACMSLKLDISKHKLDKIIYITLRIIFIFGTAIAQSVEARNINPGVPGPNLATALNGMSLKKTSCSSLVRRMATSNICPAYRNCTLGTYQNQRNSIEEE